MRDIKNPEVSVILPCRNEEEAIGQCIMDIQKVFSEQKILGEIIVSDSSTDGTAEIAKQLGAIVIRHGKEGYGIACIEGFAAARGKYMLLADADGSYDFYEIPKFLKELKKGADMVIGNRFSGNIKKGAMPLTHKYIGNPVLSFLLRLFFGAKVRDVHCGMRAISQRAYQRLTLHTTGMEFASEMVMQAVKHNLHIREIPVNYYQRLGKSKLKTIYDGWRHLRFMLLYTPLYLFLLPGALLFLLGILSTFLFYFGSINILGLELFYHPMFISSMLIIVGYQLIIFGLFAKTYSIIHLGDKSTTMEFFYKHITLEKAIISGMIMILFGAGVYLSIFLKWIESGFGELQEVKSSIVALTLVVLGVQTFFSGFMLSILGIQERK